MPGRASGVWLLCAIVLHPFDLVFGLHLCLGKGAMLTRRGGRSHEISDLEHRFAEPKRADGTGFSIAIFALSRSNPARSIDGCNRCPKPPYARASRDFFREFVWQAKGLLFQLSR
jgi:hypothetical protein